MLPVLLLIAIAAVGCDGDRGSPNSDGGDDGPPGPCANRIRDRDETDVDCGGSACAPCDDGARCIDDHDCASGRCRSRNCAVGFSADVPLAWPAGTFPTGIVAADVTGDGKADLLVSLRGELTFVTPEAHLAVLTNRGDGTFLPPVGYNSPGFALTVVAGDFNGDGIPDVALPDARTDLIAIQLADGAGGFRRSFNVTGGVATQALVTGDVDGDGVLDLVVVGEGSGLAVLRGDGTGHFADARLTPTGGSPQAAVVADFNGDHRADVAVASFADLMLFLGQPDGTLRSSPQPIRVAASNLVAGDFNQDGKADVAATDGNTGGITVLVGHGDGAFHKASSMDPVPGNSLLAAADFDRDNVLDLAASDATGRLLVLGGKGDGTFKPPTEWDAGTAPVGLCTADFDGDGRIDIAAANAETDDVTVLLGKGDGRFPRAPRLMLPSGPLTVTVADLDGDGRDDLITGSNSSGVSVHLSDGSGGFGAPADYWVGGLPDTLIARDLDGDGHPDVIAASRTSRTVYLLRNLGGGDGKLKAPQSVDTSGDPTGVGVGLLDGDDKLDLVVVDQSTGELRVLLGAGTGFRHIEPIKAGTGAFAVAVCDLDRDGRNDFTVAITGKGRKSLATLRAKGDLLWSDAVTQPFGGFDSDANASVIVCRQLDGRSGPDVALIDVGSAREKTVSVLASDDDGTLRALGSAYGGQGLASLSIGALHAGGRLHAVVASPRGVGLMLGDGSGGFAEALTYRLAGASFGAALGDFNGDGRTDVAAIVEGFPPTISLLLNQVQ